MKPAAVVIGLHENGLGVARALGRSGVPVVAVDQHVDTAFATTRYARPVRCQGLQGEGLIDTLCDIGARLDGPGVLIPTLDRSVLLVSEHRARIEPYFVHSLPEDSVVRRLMNKADTAAYARGHGFQVPCTFDVHNEETLEACLASVRFPCILKPQVKTVAFVRHAPRKAFRIDSRDELARIYRAVAAWESEVVVQEWIPGPDTMLVFCLFYFDATGRPLASFVGRKIRQFIPYCGTACSAEPYDDPVVRQAGISFFQGLNYRGFGAIEFKRDASGTYYLIEPTVGRTEHLFALAAANGVNLPYVGYCDMAGLPLPGNRPTPRRVRYRNWGRDLRAARVYLSNGEVGLRDWLASLSGPTQYSLFAWDDPRPFCSAIVRRLTRKPASVARRSLTVLGATAAAVRRYAATAERRRIARRELPSNATSLHATLDWLCAAQDSSDTGGVARGYTLVPSPDLPAGWQPPYPETTGYIIPTFFDCAHRLHRDDLRERAIRLAEWTLRLQLPNGGIPGGVAGRRHPPVVFNTGMVLLGWCRTYRETGDVRYRLAMHHGAQFLMAAQDRGGAWRRHTNVDGERRAHAYDVLVAWPMLLTAEALGDEAIWRAALRNVEFTLGLQRANGWLESNALQPAKHGHPLTHTIGYAAQGLLQAGLLAGEPRYVAAAKRIAEATCDALDKDGYLPGELDASWNAAAAWSCLTGNAQMAAIWLRFHHLTAERRYLDAARRALNFLKRLQPLRSADAGVRGGVTGSFPVQGRYGRNQCLSWAAKFFVDAILLEDEAFAQPLPAAPSPTAVEEASPTCSPSVP